MATYFNHALGADQLLLHCDVRTHNELAAVSAQAESDVINHYRERNQTGYNADYPFFGSSIASPFITSDSKYIIWLDGYKEDADDANTDARLKDALRRTIADVISHRLLHYEDEDNVKSWTRGRRSVTYAGGKLSKRWPQQWTHRLVEFDLNTAYAL